MSKIVMTCGVFDCFHEGHKNLIKKLYELGDKPIICLHDDKSTYQNKRRFPIQPYNLRRDNLEIALDSINPNYYIRYEIIEIRDSDPSGTFKILCPKIKEHEPIFVRGDDWIDFPGKRILQELGIPIEYIPYTKGCSTTQLRDELAGRG
jgi:glycerol-3-phosphate cytidylyltransferase